MTAANLAAAIVGALDDQAVAQLAERLRPHLDTDRCLLTAAQAAERLGLHPKTVVRMAREDRIPAVKVGNGWRFRPDQLHIAPPARSQRSEPPAVHHRPRLHGEPASVAAIRGRERSAA